MTDLHIDVLGTPAPQGSKKGFYNQKTQRVVIVEDSAANTKTWRQDVLTAAVAAQPPGFETIDGPVWIEATFYFKRPDGHFGTGRNAGQLKATAPAFPAVKPDVDKVLRATLDALAAAGCFRNDSRVVSVTAQKRYVDHLHRLEGAVIEVYTLDSDLGRSVPQGEGGADRPTTVQEALL
jgi:Holliday junction resolvase RusA-like endonuclease